MMRIAYLVNRYPAVSHTFIRREIAGVEAAGLEVRRFSVRGAEELADARDRIERERTEVLLGRGVLAPAAALVLAALTRPVRFARALVLAWRLGRRSPRGRLRHLAYLAEACLLRRRLRLQEAAHLHAHFGTNSAAVALLCRTLGGPPYSFTVHGPEEFDAPGPLGLREKIRHAGFVVAVSDFGRGQLMRWAEAAEWPKLHVIRCGVDGDFLGRASPLPSGPRRLVCVGRLCEDKGQVLLVEAAARLRREGREFELVLVGDGPARAAVEERVRAEGLEGRILLRGWMSGEGVRQEVCNAHLFVLPSLAEGLPVVIMEALSLGRPVISTYVAGIPELVRPGVNGWLVPAGSVEALAGALREALDAPLERLAAMGQEGARIVAERHDAGVEARKLAALFSAGGKDGAGR